jgi:hypothetical protein
MISFDEELLPIYRVPERLPSRRSGKSIHVSTVYRWCTIGCRGIVLESIPCGSMRCTSKRALERFFAALSGNLPLTESLARSSVEIGGRELATV